MEISYHFHFKGSLTENPGLVEGKDYCFVVQVYKAYKMNNLDDRNV